MLRFPCHRRSSPPTSLMSAALDCLCCSGYHHFLLAPEWWTYFGVEILGQYYVVLAFGWSPACKLFTDVMTVRRRGLGRGA